VHKVGTVSANKYCVTVNQGQITSGGEYDSPRIIIIHVAEPHVQPTFDHFLYTFTCKLLSLQAN